MLRTKEVPITLLIVLRISKSNSGTTRVAVSRVPSMFRRERGPAGRSVRISRNVAAPMRGAREATANRGMERQNSTVTFFQHNNHSRTRRSGQQREKTRTERRSRDGSRRAKRWFKTSQDTRVKRRVKKRVKKRVQRRVRLQRRAQICMGLRLMDCVVSLCLSDCLLSMWKVRVSFIIGHDPQAGA